LEKRVDVEGSVADCGLDFKGVGLEELEADDSPGALE
jgi:hypothetical protein